MSLDPDAAPRQPNADERAAMRRVRSARAAGLEADADDAAVAKFAMARRTMTFAEAFDVLTKEEARRALMATWKPDEEELAMYARERESYVMDVEAAAAERVAKARAAGLEPDLYDVAAAKFFALKVRGSVAQAIASMDDDDLTELVEFRFREFVGLDRWPTSEELAEMEAGLKAFMAGLT